MNTINIKPLKVVYKVHTWDRNWDDETWINEFFASKQEAVAYVIKHRRADFEYKLYSFAADDDDKKFVQYL